MKKTIGFTEFASGFAGRKNFSENGLRAMFKHLEEIERETGEEIEYDVITFCCEFSEYTSVEEAASDYGFIGGGSWEWLEKRTFVIKFDGGVIIRNF